MIGNRFSAAAETYDRHARPQLALAQSVVSMLPEIYPEQILELGSGTGQLTRLLTQRFPEVLIDAVDVAEKMILHSRAKFAKFPHINWIVGDAQTYWGGDRYPLIVSSSALHWVADLPKTCENIFECLEPGGTLALGMMLRGTLKELHELRESIAPEKTPDLTLPTYEETKACLQEAGFHLQRRKHSEEEIVYDDAKAFLKAIHEQGVTGGKVSTGNAPLNRSELSQLVADYQDAYASDGGVYATYETATFLLTRD
ncbi:Malonyl-[acyl-carrier protein] O-methyltransferase [Pontiella desulfatans]|uniref:Malonyl-[acyl-carrier protein] O-methyltransferase n=1 Tax=Pontiella desulfatans TaxID=2750659 RepID=A0A6C2UBZ5_PONDE|nr:methyltransferase domain-containing protein [Pontiella desulfatans]VGO16786.1 Malonyl-[acyl-carrier protein] O-methyltransferase [Pontiella desulfatans]